MVNINKMIAHWFQIKYCDKVNEILNELFL